MIPAALGAQPLTFVQELKNDRFRIPKSRYDSVSTYLANDPRLRPEYNDLDLVIDEDIKKQLMDSGMFPCAPHR